MMTLTEQILASLKFHDLIWTRTFDPDVEYPLIAENLAEQCWLAKDEIELRSMIRNALLDFYHPVQVPDIDSLEPIANDIWFIRKNYKVIYHEE